MSLSLMGHEAGEMEKAQWRMQCCDAETLERAFQKSPNLTSLFPSMATLNFDSDCSGSTPICTARELLLGP